MHADSLTDVCVCVCVAVWLCGCVRVCGCVWLYMHVAQLLDTTWSSRVARQVVQHAAALERGDTPPPLPTLVQKSPAARLFAWLQHHHPAQAPPGLRNPETDATLAAAADARTFRTHADMDLGAYADQHIPVLHDGSVGSSAGGGAEARSTVHKHHAVVQSPEVDLTTSLPIKCVSAVVRLRY